MGMLLRHAWGKCDPVHALHYHTHTVKEPSGDEVRSRCVPCAHNAWNAHSNRRGHVYSDLLWAKVPETSHKIVRHETLCAAVATEEGIPSICAEAYFP